jgi:site-specific recombinase XerD
MSRTKLPPGMKQVNDGDRSGFFIRVTGMCPVKRKILQRTVTLWGATEEQALTERARLYQEIITGGPSAKDRLPTVGEYAKLWLERNAPHIRSANTLERYQNELITHILPHFGEWVVDRVRKPDIEHWLASCAKSKYAVRSGRRKKGYQAPTVNGWLRTLKQLLQSAAADYELPDPTRKVRPLPEDPVEGNTLRTRETLAKFLEAAKTLTPQWYAMMVLGFAIGARKGELRPILKHKDINFETGHLILSKSQRRGYVGPTKSRKVRDLFLPKYVVDVLRWHISYLKQIGHPDADGPLLFPSYGGWRQAHKKRKEWKIIDPETGQRRTRTPNGMEAWSPEYMTIYQRERRRLDRARKRAARSPMLVKPKRDSELQYLAPSCLDKPMKAICEAIGLDEHISSKVMRRTFNDLARGAGINNLVIRAMTGWQDEGVQDRYTSVQATERCQAVETVMGLVGGEGLVPLPLEAGSVNN